MTAPLFPPARFLPEQLKQASPDLMRQMLTTFINALMSAEAEAVCGAEYGQISADRTYSRNSYRHLDFDTRTGTNLPDWLLELRRHRGDPARRDLATLPHSLRREPHVRYPEVQLAVG